MKPMNSSRPRPRSCRPAKARASRGVGRPTPWRPTSAAAKLARPIRPRVVSQDRPPGQPPTLGG